MAGSWIKMRTNLGTDPRVVALCASLKKSRPQILGALFVLWALGDEHSIDGRLDGYTPAAVDKACGVKGFSVALARIGWLTIDETGIGIPRFEEHNGESAKQRAVSNKRVAEWREQKRKCNADVTPPPLQNPLPDKIREEKRRTPPSEQGGVAPPAVAVTPASSPIPLSNTEARVRRWAGDAISASDRYAFAKAEREADESQPVTIHASEHPASALFVRAVDEAIAAGGTYRSAGSFLRLVGTIQARCIRDGVWPGEGLERTNGHAKEPTTAELIAADKARRAKL